MKRTRSQSTKAGSSKYMTQREPMTEFPSKGNSSLAINLELVHIGSEEDEGSEILYFRKAVEQKVLQWSRLRHYQGKSQKDRPLEVTPRQPQCLLRLFPRAPFRVRDDR